MGVLPGAGSYYFEGSDVGCLLIHGFTGTPQNVRPLADFLARRGMTVLVPRLAGHGSSVDDFERSSAEDWIGTVNTGLDQLRQTCSSVFAIGISMGGTLAMHLGATRGGDVQAVGCINAPFGRLPDFEAVLNNAQVPDRFPAPWSANHQLLTQDLGAGSITYDEIPKVCLRSALELFNQTEAMLGQVRVPVMLFHSRGDMVVPPITGQNTMEQLTAAPDKQLIDLSESAHEATLDFDLERIALEWLTFVRKHTRVLVAA